MSGAAAVVEAHVLLFLTEYSAVCSLRAVQAFIFFGLCPDFYFYPRPCTVYITTELCSFQLPILYGFIPNFLTLHSGNVLCIQWLNIFALL